MEYKSYKSDAYNIHTIKTDKFKTCQIEIVFRNNIVRDELCKRSMLVDILNESTKKYPNKRSIILEEKRLYNSNIYAVSSKLGNNILTSFVIDFINPKYCDKKMFKELMELTSEIILNPNIVDNGFNKREFNIVKNILKSDILSLKENPKAFSFNRALTLMDETSPVSFNIEGTIEDLEIVTPQNLYEQYKNILEKDLCDIFVIGNLDMDEIVKTIKDKFKLRVIKDHKIENYSKVNSRKKPLTVKETGDYTQGQLVMIYNLNNLTDKEKDTTIRMYDYLLGNGSLETKLYKYLRQDKSLCYNTASYYQKYDQILIVYAGIKASGYNEALKQVNKSFKEMSKGNFTDEEFKNAKTALIERLKLSIDSKIGLLSNLQFKVFDNLKDIDTRIKDINDVKVEDLINLSKKIKLNTIYFLSGGK